jgi:DNA-binding IclR family transcriptional regulator
MRRDRRSGSVEPAPVLDARAVAVLDALRQRTGIVSAEELRAATGLAPAALGGVLSRLKALGLASRHGQRGWSGRRRGV